MTDNVDVLAKLAFTKWAFNSMIKKLERADDPLVFMLEMFKFEQTFKQSAGAIAEAMGGERQFEPKASEREYDRSFAAAALAYRDGPAEDDERPSDRNPYSTMDLKTQGMTSQRAYVVRA